MPIIFGNPFDFAVASRVAHVQALRFNWAQPEVINEYFRTGFAWGPTNLGMFSNVGNRPGFGIASGAGQTLVFIGGCPTADAADRLCGGYLTPPNDVVGFDYNQTVAAYASLIEAALEGQPIAYSENVCISGHSLGGAIAQLIAYRLKRRSPTTNVTCMTFGSPKPAGLVFGGLNTEILTCRYMNSGDPIPVLPPSVVEAPSLSGFSSIRPFSYAYRFRHAGDGIVLGERTWNACRTTAAVLPDGFTLTLVGWATGILTQAVAEHNINVYDQRLAFQASQEEARLAALALQGAGPRNHSIDDDPPPTRVIARVMVTQPPGQTTPPDPAASPVGGEARPANVVGQLGGGRTEGVYYHSRIKGKWYVCYGDSIIALMRGNRGARKQARRLNAWVKAFNNSSTSDHPSWVFSADKTTVSRTS